MPSGKQSGSAADPAQQMPNASCDFRSCTAIQSEANLATLLVGVNSTWQDRKRGRELSFAAGRPEREDLGGESGEA